MILSACNGLFQFPNEKGVWCNSCYPRSTEIPRYIIVLCIPVQLPTHSTHHSAWGFPLITGAAPQKWMSGVLGKGCSLLATAPDHYMTGVRVICQLIWWSGSGNRVLYTGSRVHNRIKLRNWRNLFNHSPSIDFCFFWSQDPSLVLAFFRDDTPKETLALESFLKTNSEGT